MELSSGCNVIDELLKGGYEKDIVTTIYGPGGAGKTLLCMLACVECVKNGKKVIFVDTEGGFSVTRLKQVADEKVLENMFFLNPLTFQEQDKSFEKLKELVNDKIGLIVVDTVTTFYRLELSKVSDIYDLNRQLGTHISYLVEIARKKNIPILLTSQVYSDFDNKNNVKIVGGDLLKYNSKCLIELKKQKGNVRMAVVRKHRSIGEEHAMFEIVQEGVKGV